MRVVVLDAGTLGKDLDLSVLNGFGTVSVYESTSADLTAQRMQDAEVVIVNKVKLNEAALAEAKALKLICVAATGFDNIDTAACKRLGIGVCNVAGYSTDSVAQITVASVLHLACNYGVYLPFVSEGRYSASATANKVSPPFYELRDKTWGIVGYGNIGKQVGRIAEAFGCKVIVCKRNAEEGVQCVDIDTLCKESDIITLHTPLNDGTRNLIDRRRIALMKKGVILVNAARGLVTDEKALAEAVTSGHIGGLGIDVYSAEPMSADHPFYFIRNLPNICLTPHMAWAAYEARKRCLDEMVLNIQAFLDGKCRNRVE